MLWYGFLDHTGIKKESNDLQPEVVTAIVNHRINIASSYPEVQRHVIDTVLPIAKAFNLEVQAFGESVYQGSQCPMLSIYPQEVAD
jgi:hypothetical protein